MPPKIERRKANIIVVDRENLADKVQALATARELPLTVSRHASVLEVLSDSGPANAAGVLCSVGSTGPLLQDLIRWTDRDHEARVPAAVVGKDTDAESVDSLLSRDHVRWIDSRFLDEQLTAWLMVALEIQDLRAFRAQHEAIASQLREARTRIFHGDLDSYVPPEGPPCGPPLPTSIEEIQSLRDAKAQFERGLIRAAVREAGSLKDASAALGISYTSLWRRMR
jgi:hypothetical protein